MISFNYETDFQLREERQMTNWLLSVMTTEDFVCGDINYVFCDDNYLLKINQEYLNHDTFTDIISFDSSIGKTLHGDIFISIERVKENAKLFSPNFETELARVMVHGVLHFSGYKDKEEEELTVMRSKEDLYLKLLHKF